MGRRGSGRAPRPDRPTAAQVLCILSGIAIAGYSAFRISNSAWEAYTHCNPTPANYTCTYNPFWGFNPTLFLAAALAGVGLGVVLFVLAILLRARPEHHRLLGVLMMVAAFGSLVAYGGILVGTILGAVGGLLAIRYRVRGGPSVSEWSGAFPAGVPPPQPTPKALADRRPVARWDEPLINPQAASPPVARPTPNGISSRNAPAGTAAAGTPGPSVGSSPRPGLTVIPTPSRIGPLRTLNLATARRPVQFGQTSPPTPPDSPGAGVMPPPVSTPVSSGPPRLVPPPPRPAPLTVPAGPGARPIPPTARANRPPPEPPMPPAPASAPPASLGPPPKRMQAWRCAKCRLMNAPWSQACTRCHTLAPPPT